MKQFFKNEYRAYRQSWRDYQDGFKRSNDIVHLPYRSFKFLILFFLLASLCYGGSKIGCTTYNHVKVKEFKSVNKDEEKQDKNSFKKNLNKKDLHGLLDCKNFANLNEKKFTCISKGHKLKVSTTIDTSLQHFMQDKIRVSNSRMIGLVVMSVQTGKILSMIGYDKINKSQNPCTIDRFPAASIFKIVTAAGAIEQCGFDPEKIVTYNDGRWTLYKRQLEEKITKYTRTIPFSNAFGQSINSVFGKIGIYNLGKNGLTKYATAFGFNREINFEIPITPSSISVPDEPYKIAEIASGYNHETLISPIYGVVLASAVLNDGIPVEPTIIDRIEENGEVIYSSKSINLNQAISPITAKSLKTLMNATINSGTSRKFYKGHERDLLLSKLNIGGKTGSLNGNIEGDDVRYDWFVGFAEEKEGFEKIVMSILVAHEKYIGIKAAQYARLVMTKYFSDYFELKKNLKTEKVKPESSKKA
ncbi:MAG: PbpA [Desulfobacterales bacterium]|nr:PbpA [Desulfobacterales bacterium]MBF0397033.1 PbpA [Desulfobacterales bacterium]